MGALAIPNNIAEQMGAKIVQQDQDMVNLGLASKHNRQELPLAAVMGSQKPFASMLFPKNVTYSHRYTTDELGAKLARMKIYKPEKFDERMKFIDSEIQRRYVPAYRSGKRGRHYHPAQDNGAFIRTAYNNAFKSKVYTDAMKAYELRMQQPDRYIPAGHKSLENIDLLAERGGELQRRGIFGRRRSQSLGGEAVAL